MTEIPEVGLFWTVNGFIPDPTRSITEDSLRFAERYQDIVDAVTPRMAEDLARAAVRDKFDATLFVTSVFEGKVANADKYARFLDPDIVGE